MSAAKPGASAGKTAARDGPRCDGMGIGYSPTWLFEEEIARGELQVLLPDWPAPPLSIYLVSPAQRRSSAKVQAFALHMAPN
jgi:DNA-binding transcriptional LysR family regulator